MNGCKLGYSVNVIFLLLLLLFADDWEVFVLASYSRSQSNDKWSPTGNNGVHVVTYPHNGIPSQAVKCLKNKDGSLYMPTPKYHPNMYYRYEIVYRAWVIWCDQTGFPTKGTYLDLGADRVTNKQN